MNSFTNINFICIWIAVVCLVSCKDDTPVRKDFHAGLPNIIWLVAEDQSPDFFPMYGDSTVSLPNLESLAADGITFTNAYSPVPVCAPARSSIITGMYPTTLGTHNMRTYNSYQPNNQTEIGIPSYSPIPPQGVRMFTEYLRRAGYYCTNGPKEDYNFRTLASAWDESSVRAHWKYRPKESPFFAVFNFGVCHESQIWERGDDSLFVDPKEVPVPPYFPDNPIIRHDLAVNYSNLVRLDRQLGKRLDELKAAGLYDNSIIFFYGDHGGPFPRHKRALYETGVKVPMIIKFPNNDGAGTEDSRFFTFLDLAPTVLSLVGIEPPKVMQGKAQFGMYKTEKPSKYVFFSSDRFDAVYDRLRAVRSENFKYVRNFNPEISNALTVAYRDQMPMMQELNRMHRSGELDAIQSLWFKKPVPREELYDLRNDPYELKNLAPNPKYGDTLEHLRKVMDDWIEETNDLGRFEEKELLKRWLTDGKSPQVPSVEFEEHENSIELYDSMPDATIIWKSPQDSVWTIYSEPVPSGQPFVAKAVHIGYRDSEELPYTNE